MKTAFNLKKYIKKAFYEDGRGYMQAQTRSWQNCYKQKCDSGKGPQDAWNGCLEEYNKTADKGKWLENYGADADKIEDRQNAMTPAAKKIMK